MKTTLFATLTTACLTLGLLFTAGCHSSQSAVSSAPYDSMTPVEGGNLPPEMTQFGGEIQGDLSDSIPVEVVLQDLSAYKDKLIRVRGTVVEVCKPKGCWVTLGDLDAPENGVLFVKFVCPIDDTRLVPLEASGSIAVVEGKLEQIEISEDFARHLAADAGKTEDEIAKIVGPQELIRLSSPAAEIDCKPFLAEQAEKNS
ncbi:MAG: DUF4920 domain-containing protein [Planctomycetota bacterium]